MTVNNLLALLCIISGLMIIGRVMYIFYFYKVIIKKWKTTSGIVVRYCKVPEKAVDDSGWTDELVYTYSVNGTSYESNKYSKNMGLSVPFEYQVELKGFKKGDDVIVFYNPDNPSESIVNNKFSYYNLAFIIMSIIAFAVASNTYEGF